MADTESPLLPPIATEPAPADRPRDPGGRFASRTLTTEPPADPSLADSTPPPDDDTEPSEPTPIPRRLRIARDEFDLPDDLPDDVVERAHKTAHDLTVAWNKSMETTAAERKAQAEEHRARLAEVAATHEALDLVAEAKALQTQIKAYEGVNWQGLVDSDPTLAQKHWMQYQALQTQLQSKERDIASKRAEITSKQREAYTRAAARMNEELSAKLPGWNSERAAALRDFGRTYGFTPDEISATLDPRAVRVLHDAFLYHESRRKALASLKPTAPKPSPAAKVTGTAKAGRSLDDPSLPMDVWIKERDKQLGRRN